MASTPGVTPDAAAVPPPLVAAAGILRFVGWACICIPLGFVVAYLPGSLFLLLFGGSALVAPPVAVGVVGVQLAKSLRRGFRPVATFLFAMIQGGLLLVLSISSTGWSRNPDEEGLYRFVTFVTFLGGSLSTGAAFLVAAGMRHLPLHEVEEGARPRLWRPILVALALAAVALLLTWPRPGTT